MHCVTALRLSHCDHGSGAHSDRHDNLGKVDLTI